MSDSVSPPEPPPLLEVFGGDWPPYELRLYNIFVSELAEGGLEYREWPIRCRRRPEINGKWALFWHLVQEGKLEEDRTPDLRRCERVRWIRWVIEHAGQHTQIDCWHNTRDGETNCLLWFREEYLVILARRTGYWLLKTAYCTDQSGRIAQLRRERDSNLQALKS